MMRSRVICYVRVSTDRQVEKWSPPAQCRALQEYAELQGWEVVGRREDLGISGKTIDERPGMLELLEDLRAGRADYALAVEFERFSRGSSADWDRLLDACERGGAKLATPSQIIDPRCPEDLFMGDLFGALSRRERRKTAERSARGMRERVRAGKWNGRAPYGYRTTDSGHLEPHSEEAPVVERMFQLLLSHSSFLQIAATLTAEGVPTRHRSPRWSGVQVKRVLRSSACIGELVFEGTKRGGEEMTIRVDGAHPAIVPAHVFRQAMALIEARSRAGLPKSRWNSGYFLVGLLACSTCGGRMNGTTSRNRRRPGENKAFRYYICMTHRCRGAGSGPKCRRIRAERVEDAVLEKLAGVLANDSFVQAVRRQVVEERMRGNTSDSARRAELEATIADAEHQIRFFYKDRVAGRLTGEQFDQWNREQVERQRSAREEIRAIEDRLLALGRHVDVERVVAQLGDVGKVLRHLEPAGLKQLVGDLIRSVRVVGDDGKTARVQIEYRLPGMASGARGRKSRAAL
jgi:site-specific DNA recombinase